MRAYHALILRIVDGNTADVCVDLSSQGSGEPPALTREEIEAGGDLGYGITLAGGRILIYERVHLAGVKISKRSTEKVREGATRRLAEHLPLDTWMRMISEEFSPNSLRRSVVDFNDGHKLSVSAQVATNE